MWPWFFIPSMCHCQRCRAQWEAGGANREQASHHLLGLDFFGEIGETESDLRLPHARGLLRPSEQSARCLEQSTADRGGDQASRLIAAATRAQLGCARSRGTRGHEAEQARLSFISARIAA